MKARDFIELTDTLEFEGYIAKEYDNNGRWTGRIRITEKGIDYVETECAEDKGVQELMKKKKSEV